MLGNWEPGCTFAEEHRKKRKTPRQRNFLIQTNVLGKCVLRALMKILKDESGQTVVLMAAFMGLLALGFAALAVDIGYFFHEKRMAQAAADAAAIAAAEESVSGNTGNMQSVANSIAKMNGFDTTLASHPATVQINAPPLYGSYAGNSGYVEVIVSRPVPTLLLGASSTQTRR